MDVTIHIDRTRCIGSGQCVYVAPGAFDQDDESKAVVRDHHGDPAEAVVRAITACPVQAVSLRVGSAEVDADDLRDWAHAAHVDDPLMELLGELGEDHHHLQTLLDVLERHEAGPGDPFGDFLRLARHHVQAERGVYGRIAERVDSRLTETFAVDLDAIDRSLDDLDDAGTDPARRADAVRAAGAALRAHIRLEETVLFPVAMAASLAGAPPSR